MKIKSIEKNNNEITVTVTVPSVYSTKGKRVVVTTKDVESELKKQNIEFAKCTTPTELWNTNANRLSAQWIFSVSEKKLPEAVKEKKLPEAVKEKKLSIKKTARKARTSRFVKTVVDKEQSEE